MKSIEFGSFIKAIRESKSIPQRIVAHKLDIDTSTLSKIELGERQVNIEMIKGLAEVFEIDFKSLQIKFITEKLLSEYNEQPFFKEALIQVIENLE
ncbi:MAG: helix-turn-helix transcriptional regulator [Bacteroidales bacterium]|nr:helix-turn-helix transcriptional regulator [Bacteroidales bacterium]